MMAWYFNAQQSAGRELRAWIRVCFILLASILFAPVAQAQETVCAKVKIEIKQKLTLERQAFDAEMRINNTTDTGLIENVSVVVKVTDEAGNAIAVTDNPNDISAKFFIRLTNKQNISDVSGAGSVVPRSTAVMNWLLIPSPGAAGTSPAGKKYLVGATLRYRYAGEDTVLEVSPDVITVKPLPLLTLDYFLTQDVWADDPLTSEIEPVEPFTLGVRVKNSGFANAKNLQIDSAQPKIVENNQGLAINFVITGSYLNDAPAQNTLLINFGDISAGTSKMGRWVMEASLAGKFTEFTARFSHADELGGALTSLIKETNAHLLIRDVRVDLPGRDYVRDFLAYSGDVIRLYESDGPDSEVVNQSAFATLTTGSSGGSATYRLSFPPTAGFAYVKLSDPFNGTKALGTVVRSDAKNMLAENVWLSKTRNSQTKQWEYWINFFDVNTTGVYDTGFQAPATGRPPVLQLIPDRVVKEGRQVSFLVEASSPDGKPVSLSASPLPVGARLMPQGATSSAATLASAVFDWTPALGSAGDYVINYIASDGALSTSRAAKIKVEVDTPPPGPSTPGIDAPLAGGMVTQLRPSLSALASSAAQDPTTKLQFELYADQAMSQLLVSALLDKATGGSGTNTVVVPTVWQLPNDLLDNTSYFWRVRGFDGTLYSPWANANFRVNQFNDAPEPFNLASPAPNGEVSVPQPTLSWVNSSDKDGDTVTYSVSVYSNATLTQTVTSVVGLVAGVDGQTSWQVNAQLLNRGKYYWRVTAVDSQGALTVSPVRIFTVIIGNTAPTAPVIVSPALGGQNTAPSAALTIQNSTDADNDLITYIFELDTQNSFDTANKRSSGPIIQGSGTESAWTVSTLVENQRYWWRVKAQDGRSESGWVVGDFLMNAVNDPPPVPTVNNPGNGAWSSTQQPSLIANPVVDPEGEAVQYHFQVFRDSGLTQLVTEGVSANTGWIVPVSLVDKTTHWWRVRAVDTQNTASAWSAPAVLYISTAPYQAPTIRVTAPNTTTAPREVNTPQGRRKQVTIRWEGNDPNIEPTIALYYSTANSGFAGTLITDGLRQAAGVQTGSYVWDVTDLPTGVYFVYGVIYDSQGTGRAYAPGSVVIPSSPQAGFLVQDRPGTIRYTTEAGGTTSVRLKLGREPASDVVVPLSSSRPSEGQLQTPALTFTPLNWNTYQSAVVVGVDDCAPDPNTGYQIVVGNAQSQDTNYINVTGVPFEMANRDNTESRSTTDNPNIYICGLQIVSEIQINRTTWEYQLRGDLTNIGTNIGGVTANLVAVPSGHTIVEPVLQFGAVNQYEFGRTQDTITVRTRAKVSAGTFKTANGYRWSVTTTP